MRGLHWVLLLGVAPATVEAACTPRLEWRWDGAVQSPGSPNLCSTPLVVQLTDDNLDNRIDSFDIPDVVFIHDGAQGELTALDGATGVERP